MLDVDRADDVDPGREQVLHVFVTFSVFGAGRVRVRELIHQCNSGMSRENRIHIHLAELDAVILHGARRDNFQVLDLCGGFGTIMRLDISDHDIDTAILQPVALDQHLVGFSDAGRRAQINLQFTELLPPDDLEKIFRVRLRRSRSVSHARMVPPHRSRRSIAAANQKVRIASTAAVNIVSSFESLNGCVSLKE